MDKLVLLSLLTALVVLLPSIGQGASLVQDGDRWVCLGDSITAQGIYPRILGRVFAHYHPEATLTVINSGQGGDTASDDPAKLAERVLKHKPTIVSIMYGIERGDQLLEAGAAQGADSGALPDGPGLHGADAEGAGRDGAADVADADGSLLRVVVLHAGEDDPVHAGRGGDHAGGGAGGGGCYMCRCRRSWRPYQQSLPAGIILRSDGVHVSALGQYQMARSLWEAGRFDQPLGGNRELQKPAAAAPVRLALGSRFVATDATAIGLKLQVEKPVTVTATWSLGDQRGQETLKLHGGRERVEPGRTERSAPGPQRGESRSGD